MVCIILGVVEWFAYYVHHPTSYVAHAGTLCSSSVGQVEQKTGHATFAELSTSVEAILENKAGYTELNMNSLEAGLQSPSDSAHGGAPSPLHSLQHSSERR